MAKAWITLGNDSFNFYKGLRIVLYFVLTAFWFFTLVNVPAEWGRSVVFLFMMVFPFIAFIIDMIWKKFEWIDVILEETSDNRPIITRRAPFWLIISIAMFLVFFSYMSITSAKQSIVSAPTFQMIEQFETQFMKAVLSGIWGIGENFFFFGFLYATIFAWFGRLTGNEFVTMSLSIPSASLLFTGYHFLVYGTTNIAASTSVFSFALINCLLIYLFRSLIIADIWHFSNNFLVSSFAIVKVGFGL